MLTFLYIMVSTVYDYVIMYLQENYICQTNQDNKEIDYLTDFTTFISW